MAILDGSKVQVKICGLTTLADATLAAESGADLLGFIFYERSPRAVSPQAVCDIVAGLREGLGELTPRLVGVFVNWTPPRVAETLDTCGLDLAQLHGEEGPEALSALVGRAYKSLRPRSLAEAKAAAHDYLTATPVAGPDLLLDAYHPNLRGGSGAVGDWQLAAGLARQCRLLLAGGLTPGNVAAAIAQVRPWGVDVASGVEAAPGRKDPALVRAFVAAIRGYGHE